MKGRTKEKVKTVNRVRREREESGERVGDREDWIKSPGTRIKRKSCLERAILAWPHPSADWR